MTDDNKQLIKEAVRVLVENYLAHHSESKITDKQAHSEAEQIATSVIESIKEVEEDYQA